MALQLHKIEWFNSGLYGEIIYGSS